MILRESGKKLTNVGVIMPDARGNVGVKLSAFLIMNPMQVAEFNRQVGSLDREVRRKKLNPIVDNPF